MDTKGLLLVLAVLLVGVAAVIALFSGNGGVRDYPASSYTFAEELAAEKDVINVDMKPQKKTEVGAERNAKTKTGSSGNVVNVSHH